MGGLSDVGYAPVMPPLGQPAGMGAPLPPRVSGYIEGPGGPRTDSIPARLSDGEFVMTADAVNGAGGPEPMYDLMDRLERRG